MCVCRRRNKEGGREGALVCPGVVVSWAAAAGGEEDRRGGS